VIHKGLWFHKERNAAGFFEGKFYPFKKPQRPDGYGGLLSEHISVPMVPEGQKHGFR
jgi:hypothetical protein